MVDIFVFIFILKNQEKIKIKTTPSGHLGCNIFSGLEARDAALCADAGHLTTAAARLADALADFGAKGAVDARGAASYPRRASRRDDL